MAKPSLPQGTRDFSADVVRKRQYILHTIKTVFELYGFQPLETPAIENLDTLMGKYGEEGDKLIFKILNNGLDNPSKEQQTRQEFEKVLQGKNTKAITERALKYDLTIPFARYIAMNHHQLTFPFKRYQIQPVWRADRPQKGRYREFYQCDADVVGSNSLMNELELLNIYNDVFEKLGIQNYELRINNRKIFLGVAEAIGATEKMIDLTIAIDKFDKIGWNGVKEELYRRGFTQDQISKLTDFVFAANNRIVNLDDNKEESEDFILFFLKNAAKEYLANKNYQEGIADLEKLLQTIKSLNSKVKIVIDVSLARGLNYYTGLIVEAKAPAEVNIGSIGGGGRYDDLTGLFGVPNIPGVGISFGVDRIYDVMEELKLFPETIAQGSKVLFFNLGEEESKTAYQLLQQLRKKGIASEIYHEPAKFDKQFKYAEKKNIPFVIILGSKELEQKLVQVKDLLSGEQKSIPFENLSDFLFI